MLEVKGDAVSDLVAVLCCVEQGASGRVLVVRGS